MTPEQDRQNQPVAITHTFAGVPVTDYTAAYDWYVRLLGRGADMFPHQSECVWRLTPTSSIYVAQDPHRAGSALVTLALDDLDAHERRLHETGFTFTEEASGAAPRRLVVSDIDGNKLAFFQDPSSTGA
jgi:catechol 2,3-dioxygenase-like lactoylglutathione lyase family enzyme